MSSIENWSTEIAEVQSDDVLIRGYRLSRLIGRISFTDSVYLVHTGELPTPQQRAMLDAIFVALIEHGISPSTIIARTLASCGTPSQAAVGGALLSIADWHGGSGEQLGAVIAEIVSQTTSQGLNSDGTKASLQIRAAELVAEYRSKKQRFEGFGHPQHPEGDPRGILLMKLADDLGVTDLHVTLVRMIDQEIEKSMGRRLAVNVTGAIAALLLDLGFSWRAIRGMVMVPRSAGLVAHVVEEIEQGNKWRHAASENVTYLGRTQRDLLIEHPDNSKR